MLVTAAALVLLQLAGLSPGQAPQQAVRDLALLAPAPPAPPTPPVPPAPPTPPASRPGAGAGEGLLRGEWPARPSGKRVTLDESGTVADAIQSLADKAGWSVVIRGGAADQELKLKARDVPAEDALRAVLQGTGLAATRHGEVIVVAPARDLEPTATEDLGAAIGVVTGSIARQAAEAARREAQATSSDAKAAARAAASDAKAAAKEASAEAKRAAKEAKRKIRDALRDREKVGGDVVIEAGQAARDVSAVGGSVTLRPGAEADDVVAVGGEVVLEAGAKCKDAVSVGGDVRVGPDAVVEGDAVSIGGEIKIDPSGEVQGEHVNVGAGGLTGLLGAAKAIKEKRTERSSEHGVAWSFFKLLLEYAIFFALALLVVLLVPRRVEVVAATVLNDPLRSVATGLLAVLAQPLVSLLLIVTIVGIPLLLVQLLGVVLVGVIGFTAAAVVVGRRLPLSPARRTPTLQLAAGMAVVVLATNLPYLGWLLWIVLMLAAFGAVVRTRFGQEPGAPVPPPPSPWAAGPASPPPASTVASPQPAPPQSPSPWDPAAPAPPPGPAQGAPAQPALPPGGPPTADPGALPPPPPPPAI